MNSSKVLGEREIIEIMWKQLERMPKMPVQFGDDVSACEIGDGRLAVLKTDMLVGKTDVPRGMSLWQAARKAVVMNVSDFAAKGVKPVAVLAAIGLPKGISKKEVEDVGKGLNAGAREYGAYVIGGDTGEASDLVISVSLFGLAERGSLMLRSGAKAGDIVAVTGLFGKTSAALKVLLCNLQAHANGRDVLLESVLMPHARLNEGIILARTGAVTASIDSSDGLAWSLHEISKASGVGFVVDTLPYAGEAEDFAKVNGLDLFELVFYGGEEYELIVTVDPTLWPEAERAVKASGGMLMPVGKVTSEREVVFVRDGKRSVIERRGYEHFKT